MWGRVWLCGGRPERAQRRLRVKSFGPPVIRTRGPKAGGRNAGPARAESLSFSLDAEELLTDVFDFARFADAPERQDVVAVAEFPGRECEG